MRSNPAPSGLSSGMFHVFQSTPHQLPARMLWFMAAAWVLILAKCTAVWWAIGHWQVPIHPAWVIAPTLLLAAVATGLWAAHYGERD